MVDHEGLERPREPAARELRTRLSSPAEVFDPEQGAGLATVAAHTHQQRSWPVAERVMSQLTRHGASRSCRPLTGAAHVVDVRDSTLEDRATDVDVLPRDRQAQVVEAAEGGQVGRAEGNVRQVEVFPIVSVRTSIMEDLDVSPNTYPAARPTPSSVKSR